MKNKYKITKKVSLMLHIEETFFAFFINFYFILISIPKKIIQNFLTTDLALATLLLVFLGLAFLHHLFLNTELQYL